MRLSNLPVDINAELLLSWLPEGSFHIEIVGQHKRNAYNDIIEIELSSDNSSVFHIGRNSLYNALPEYLFHPLDRFGHLPANEEKERFAEQLEKQEQERTNAFHFFKPLDLLLFLYRAKAREELRQVTDTDSVLTGIIGDRLTEKQKSNRFIKKTVPFLTDCRRIRGNKTLLSQMLRKVMMEEGMKVSLKSESLKWCDESPRYADSLDDELGESFVGNVYDEETVILDVDYWPETVDDKFPLLLEELEEYRIFVSDFFLSMEEILRFSLNKDSSPVILGEIDRPFYLNYNTTI